MISLRKKTDKAPFEAIGGIKVWNREVALIWLALGHSIKCSDGTLVHPDTPFTQEES